MARVVAFVFLLFGSFLAAAASSQHGAEVHGIGAADDPTRQTDENWVDDRWQKTDVGQFLSACIEMPEKTYKGIAIKIGVALAVPLAVDVEPKAGGRTGSHGQVHPFINHRRIL